MLNICSELVAGSSEQNTIKSNCFSFVFSGSLLCMGALFGSLSAVYLMDAVGRKASLLAFSVMSLFIGWTLLMAASQHWQLYTGRFLLGKVYDSQVNNCKYGCPWVWGGLFKWKLEAGLLSFSVMSLFIEWTLLMAASQHCFIPGAFY